MQSFAGIDPDPLLLDGGKECAGGCCLEDKPLEVISSGGKMDALQMFHPERMADRIPRMGAAERPKSYEKGCPSHDGDFAVFLRFPFPIEKDLERAACYNAESFVSNR